MRTLQTQCCAKYKDKYNILFLARLKVFCEDTKVKVYNDPQPAAIGLRQLGVNMDIPKKEIDLESILQTAGW